MTERTLTVEVEDRTLPVAVENRTDTIPVDIRTLTVPGPYTGQSAQTFTVAAAVSVTGVLTATANLVSAIPTSGLGLWLDAAQITGLSDGAAVTTWTDSSSSGFNATAAATPPVYRTAGINGKPAVEFTGSASTAEPMSVAGWGTALSGKTEYTLFFVANLKTLAPSVPVLFVAPYATSGWQWLLEYNTDGGIFWGHGGYRLYNAGISPLTPHLVSLSFSAGSPHMFVNGTEITAYAVYGGDMAAAVPSSLGSNVELSGYDVGNTYGVDGYVGEAIWYDHAVGDTERQQIEAYLTNKWGL